MSLESVGTSVKIDTVTPNGKRVVIADVFTPFYGVDAVKYALETAQSDPNYKELNYDLMCDYSLNISTCVHTRMPNGAQRKFNLNNVPYCKRVMIQNVIRSYNDQPKTIDSKPSMVWYIVYNKIRASMLLTERSEQSSVKYRVTITSIDTGEELQAVEYDELEYAAWFWVNTLESCDSANSSN